MAMYGGGDEAGWPHGGMIDMAKSPETIARETAPMAACAPSPCAVPEYPWGLSISFENETLQKLGLDGNLPTVGDIFEFSAAAKVTSASMTENIDPATGQPKQCCRVELQIVGMLPHEEESAVEDAMEQSAARRQRFYGGGEAAARPYSGIQEAKPWP